MSDNIGGIKTWFDLRRDNFFLDPRNRPEDRQFFASRPRSLNIQQQITSLELDLEAAMAPKKLYWGPYGSGKTHTLYKALYELSKRLSIHVAFVECPVLKKNSTFSELYAKTLEELSMDFVILLFNGALNLVVKETGFTDPKGVEKKLIEMVGDEDLGRAAYRTITQQLDQMIIWRWITAMSISAGERRDLRVRDDLSAADPTRLIGIMIAIAKLLRRIKNQTLVLVYDELDRARYLNPEAVGTFSTAFTRLTEPGQTDIASFFSLSASRIDELPGFLTESVRNRIGKESIVEIPGMAPEDVRPFVGGVVGYVRDPSINVDERVKSYKDETEENLQAELYPFTVEALDAIKTACGQVIVPRDICRLMGRGAAYAKLRNKHVVTSKDIESASTGIQ